jgi:hypothetical protein
VKVGSGSGRRVLAISITSPLTSSKQSGYFYKKGEGMTRLV